MKEEPAFRSLSRRTLLGRVIQGLGVPLALGHAIPRACMVEDELRDRIETNFSLK